MNRNVSIKLLLLGIFTITCFYTLQAQTRNFRIVGYVTSWKDVPAFTQSFDFKQVTHLNWAFLNPDASGNLVGGINGLTQLIASAHENNVKVLISIGGGSAGEGMVKDNFHRLISTKENRADFIHRLMIYLDTYQLDGLDVDEEGPAINKDYGAFINQLSDSLKHRGRLMTTAVGWGNENIPDKVLPLFDFVTLMAYDKTGSWDQNRPGPHSPYSYAEQMIKDFKARGVKKEKLCLGLPFYGYGFYNSAGDYNYNKLLAKFPDAWQKDQVGDTIYYNGIPTIWKKTKLAMAQTSGVMIWELSHDTIGERSLLRVISSTVDSIGVPSSKNKLSKLKGK
jgi:GH18 family chitinase